MHESRKLTASALPLTDNATNASIRTMNTIVLKTAEYQELKTRADAYDRLVFAVREEIFSPPPTRNRAKIISELKKTKRYNNKFLESLARGLKRSSYFTP